jgi:hypothetical protein
LRQRRLDLVAQINVHARSGISFLFHARRLNPQNDERARKFRAMAFAKAKFFVAARI